MIKRILGVATTLLTAPGAVVLAQTAPTAVPSTGVPTSILGFYTFICDISNWFFAFVIIIAVIFILYGAIKFFTAGGSEDAIATARRALMYGLIGIAVAVLARSFVFVVGNFVGADSTGFFAC